MKTTRLERIRDEPWEPSATRNIKEYLEKVQSVNINKHNMSETVFTFALSAHGTELKLCKVFTARKVYSLNNLSSLVRTKQRTKVSEGEIKEIRQIPDLSHAEL